jgi:PhnB protein
MQLTPYIIFNGNCEEALKFYEKVLGGTIGHINRYSDMPPGMPDGGMTGDKIMHTDFKVKGNVLFLASDGPTQDKDSGMVSLSLNFTDAGSIQSTFAAMSDGSNVTMALQDTFWGATFGMLQDRFGIKWMFNYDKPKP